MNTFILFHLHKKDTNNFALFVIDVFMYKKIDLYLNDKST